MEQTEKKYDTGLGTFSIVLIVIAAALFVFALFAPATFTMPAKDGKGFSDTGEIGDTIGGLMSPFINLAAVIVTGLAFYMQYRANRLQVVIFTDQLKETERQFKLEQASQEKQNKIQQFESQFFEMLRLHKANVDELSIKSVINGKEVTRRQAFVTMSDEFKTFLGYIQFGNSPFEKEYRTAYDIFFWGWNSDYVDLNSLSNAWFIIEKGPDPSDADYDHTIDFREYNGYSGSLGHYFRHLFMMVKFVAYSDIITEYKDKMKYLKILRAQLSNHEQIMLFYNWLNIDYGGAWEDDENRFFTDYKMIHNLWGGELFQNQYIIEAVNGLIDKYNLSPKETPLFEFQGDDFNFKMKNIENKPLSENLN